MSAGSPGYSPYISFTREEWANFRAATPLTLTESDLERMRGKSERISIDEVTEVYLPLSRLLNLHVAASQDLYKATDTFLSNPAGKVPYVIGIAGSVAVGKSTTARILQALLSRWPAHRKVDLVTTDGFLYPNRVLEQRGLMGRKGFPESYDRPRLIRFLTDVKSGRSEVAAPVYSHLTYDIVPDRYQIVRRPDIVILEGLTVLETGWRKTWSGETSAAPDTLSRAPARAERLPSVFVSDFFDFSIYVDAAEENIVRWYVERFLTLVDTAFRDPSSYFHRYATLKRDEAVEVAEAIWRDINGPNLRENIQPTRERARLILRKGPHHRVEEVRLRRI